MLLAYCFIKIKRMGHKNEALLPFANWISSLSIYAACRPNYAACDDILLILLIDLTRMLKDGFRVFSQMQSYGLRESGNLALVVLPSILYVQPVRHPISALTSNQNGCNHMAAQYHEQAQSNCTA